MIRTAVVCMSLACWPAIGYTQRVQAHFPASAIDLVPLTFSPGPASGDVVIDPGTADEAGGPSGSVASGDMTDLVEAVREAEEEIGREEALNGPTSPGSIERLESVAELYRELGDFPLATAALDRARQITRVHDGLYSPNQIEIMETMIDGMEEAGAY